MRVALLFLLLAPKGTLWSEAHGIGIRPPDTWKIVERDKEARAFVIEGPELGPGTPRAVVWNAGPAETTLEKRADELAKAIKKREGFRVVARKRKVIGPYAAIRFGLEIALDGGRKATALPNCTRTGLPSTTGRRTGSTVVTGSCSTMNHQSAARRS